LVAFGGEAAPTAAAAAAAAGMLGSLGIFVDGVSRDIKLGYGLKCILMNKGHC
jgi:hypothetical protein